LKQPVLFTKAGNKVVGTYIGNGVGSVFLVPPIDSDSSQFVRKVRGDLNWTPYARKFGKELMACLIGLHTALIAERVDSPPPGWVEDSCYSIPEEIALTQAIEKIDRDLGELTGAKNSLIAKKKTVGGMRRLLYEKGRPLENAVIKVLHLMSFEAQAFKDGESEFDVVFVSPEGRFLGEVEGKDNKAINIDKHSQLERNVNEDFERDGVTEHAHGVLFGNGFRLLPLRERKDFFTEKCASAAKRTGTALVRTPDLFEVARYLESSEDKALPRCAARRSSKIRVKSCSFHQSLKLFRLLMARQSQRTRFRCGPVTQASGVTNFGWPVLRRGKGGVFLGRVPDLLAPRGSGS
jgi:hypothetical protein